MTAYSLLPEMSSQSPSSQLKALMGDRIILAEPKRVQEELFINYDYSLKGTEGRKGDAKVQIAYLLTKYRYYKKKKKIFRL